MKRRSRRRCRSGEPASCRSQRRRQQWAGKSIRL